jgi:hypothetical protein
MTKSEEWKEFKRVKEDVLSEYTDTDKAAIVRKWKNECLEPLGYNHEFKFIRCDKMPEEEKAKHCAEWAQMFKDGKFSPDKAKPKSKKKPKRGASLDDLSLDDNPEDASPDVEVNEPSSTKEALEELGDEPATQPEPVTKQPKIIDKLNNKTVDAMKKHKEETTMATTPKSKSKKELLLEAISALEEEENTGITEEQVEEISKRVAVKVFADLFSEVSETITSALSSDVEDTKNQ